MDRIGANLNGIMAKNLQKAKIKKEDLKGQIEGETVIKQVNIKNLLNGNMTAGITDKSSSIAPPENMDINPNTNDNDGTLNAHYHFDDEDSFWLKNDDKENGFRPGDHGTFISEEGELVRFFIIEEDDGSVHPWFEYGKVTS